MAPPKRPWFRFYVEAIHDRKLRRRPPCDRWLWVVLLAVAREATTPGALTIGATPASDTDLADLAALKLSEVQAALRYFHGEGMLTTDGDGIDRVTKFNDRQYESDVTALRMAKQRSSDDDVTTIGGQFSRARVTDTDSDTDLKPTTLPTAPQIGVLGNGFEEFWQAYPRPKIGVKPDKQICQRRWAKLSKADRAAAFVGLTHYTEALAASDTPAQYPATYLNKRTWEAHQAPAQPPVPSAATNGHRQALPEPRRPTGWDASRESYEAYMTRVTRVDS
ncbi:MAG: hypothetical protein NVS1B16_05650 [Pseudarthrobacter sp.]